MGGPHGSAAIYREAPATHRSGFTALEWQVIALAQTDSLSSLNAPSRVSVALETVFGFKRANPELANPALEILRRISVLAWHRGFALPQSQIEAFHDAGYSEDQLETLLGSIGAGRLARKRKAFA
ncbi:MAG: hypothetical protein EOP60_11065 [Sphingomonadales bacterium]|nr:MAG: hypothetical protein EOP60_11065 [Sphingomonadales bacterium]